MQRWNDFWSILWNILLAAVSLNWSGVQQGGADLVAWWDSLWSVILARFQAVWDGVTNLSDYISEVLSSVWDGMNYRFSVLWDDLMALIDSVWAGLWDNVLAIRDYLEGLIGAVYTYITDLLQIWLEAAIAAVTPFIQAAIAWVTDTFGWILDLQSLITGWLVAAKAVIDWLWNVAWTQLQAFLADPLGFVLGLLIDDIRNLLNWWIAWGEPLRNFVSEDLPALRNLLALGLTFLQTFVNDPLQTILDLIYPVFLDWLEDLIADNW